MAMSHRERRQRKYDESLKHHYDNNRDRKTYLRTTAKRQKMVVYEGPEPSKPKRTADHKPRPVRADLRIAELRAELEANRAARVVEENKEELMKSSDSDKEDPIERPRVRIHQPFVLPTREQIAALCLDAYRIALDHVSYDKDGEARPQPMVGPAVNALRALTEVCGYTQVKRNTISDEQYAEERNAVDAEEALERMRAGKAKADLPKPRF